MATTDSTLISPPRRKRQRLRVIIALLAVLAPLAYFAGRLSPEYFTSRLAGYAASGVVSVALGVMVGIPIGLFFGTLRRVPEPVRTLPNTHQMEQTILQQLRAELAENKALFDARKGSTTMFARIDYITPFWTSIKASGRLFVMQDAELLATIATAYYWLDQATHLEKLAYETKYAHEADGDVAASERLINEVRLLDGQIETTSEAAIAAIDIALAAS